MEGAAGKDAAMIRVLFITVTAYVIGAGMAASLPWPLAPALAGFARDVDINIENAPVTPALRITSALLVGSMKMLVNTGLPRSLRLKAPAAP